MKFKMEGDEQLPRSFLQRLTDVLPEESTGLPAKRSAESEFPSQVSSSSTCLSKR